MLLIAPAALIWVLFAKIAVYEVSSSARLEVLTMPHSVAAEVEGRVVDSKLHIGLETRKGDVLVTLDGDNVRRLMDEPQQRIAAAKSQLDVIQNEIDSKQQSLAARAQARELAARESQSQLELAETRAKFAELSLQRALSLATHNVMSPQERERIQAEADTARGAVEVSRLAVARGTQDRLADEKNQAAELADIQQESAKIAGEMAIHKAALRRLEHELDLRSIRAHVTGRVEEVLPFRMGSVVRPSEKLATIVPPGEPRVVALLPVIAVGRIVPEQAARLRLDGFPWTQYGTLSATVTGVGNEPTDGVIRVELSVTPDPTSRIPLQHGQTGSVEIEVEQASPAMLILRAAGRYLMTYRPAAGR